MNWNNAHSLQWRNTQFFYVNPVTKGGIVIISELVMLAGGSDSENVLISLRGNIDLNTISRLSESIDIDGFDGIESIQE